MHRLSNYREVLEYSLTIANHVEEVCKEGVPAIYNLHSTCNRRAIYQLKSVGATVVLAIQWTKYVCGSYSHYTLRKVICEFGVHVFVCFESHNESTSATARIHPALAPSILTGKQLSVKP